MTASRPVDPRDWPSTPARMDDWRCRSAEEVIWQYDLSAEQRSVIRQKITEHWFWSDTYFDAYGTAHHICAAIERGEEVPSIRRRIT